MSKHDNYKFSITIHSDNLAVVNCLRALSQYSQKTGNNRIPCSGTKNEDWKRDGHQVTFRFTSTEYRQGFVSEINQLLPSNLWGVVGESDNDPAV